jgi:predicted metal-dependent peptidase
VNTLAVLEKEELRFFQAMRLNAIQIQPYMASVLFAMIPVVESGLGTFAVDRHWRLYLDMEVAKDWGRTAGAGVLLHEAHHLLRSHCDRGVSQQVSSETAMTWNLACDAAINDDLVAADIDLPSPIVPASLGFAPGGLEEQYYQQLRAREEANEGQSCGSGAGGRPGLNELDVSDSPIIDEIDASSIREEVRREVRRNQHGMKIPTGLNRWAHGFTEPKAPWATLLRRVVRSELRCATGRLRTTWHRPYRRGDASDQFLRPGNHRTHVRVAVVFDTSASMHQRLLDAAAAELRGVLKATRARTIAVIACDAIAHAPRDFGHCETIRMEGGGQTDLRNGIVAATELSPSPSLIIVLTDGETVWPSRAPEDIPVIAVVIGNKGSLPAGTGISALRISIQ